METAADQRIVAAREGLLDAVEVLGSHGEAVILVGAQAIYVHTGEVDIGSAASPFTYDTDIAIDPALLGNDPTIIDAMSGAGFKLTNQPGLYRRESGAQVDLLVPEAVGGPGRRGARLDVHGNRAAMKVHGLEGALVSHAPKGVRSLIPGSDRSCVMEVAGPAALLVAKVHKISERVDNPFRRADIDKDAFDIYRVLIAVDTSELASEVRLLQVNSISKDVTAEALTKFRELFGDRSSPGTDLVVQHILGLENPEFIAASSEALSQDLLDAISY